VRNNENLNCPPGPQWSSEVLVPRRERETDCHQLWRSHLSRRGNRMLRVRGAAFSTLVPFTHTDWLCKNYSPLNSSSQDTREAQSDGGAQIEILFTHGIEYSTANYRPWLLDDPRVAPRTLAYDAREHGNRPHRHLLSLHSCRVPLQGDRLLRLSLSHAPASNCFRDNCHPTASATARLKPASFTGTDSLRPNASLCLRLCLRPGRTSGHGSCGHRERGGARGRIYARHPV
jgi:hypothetical protein